MWKALNAGSNVVRSRRRWARLFPDLDQYEEQLWTAVSLNLGASEVPMANVCFP